ncbi:hypothetical protein L2Y94_16555 [Luteibacter aegosomatis]|uniref:hypothetical protein n=1 Tax=Luteibacter aegosomatis TaxID=2911537 RepID=UPI001FF7B6C1|nr:hypothetical protein [Luteibacter aegosomatis]UPG84912.1 hypothetical protein L2Y94_16555 [Luteibacter aegosomatis]
MNIRRLLVVAAIACGTSGMTFAASFPVAHALPDARLDTIRGGFDLGDDLRASFALERTVLVNGVEAIRTSVKIPDVARMSIDQANALAAALRTTVVTNGPGGIVSDAAASAAQAPAVAQAATAPVTVNAVSTASQAAAAGQAVAASPSSGVTTATLPASSVPGLVLQNALDNQAITATTTIDASVNTSSFLQGMRIDESVRNAVIQFRGN